jgi:hypothetical protein
MSGPAVSLGAKDLKSSCFACKYPQAAARSAILPNTPYGPTPALHSSHFLTKSSGGRGGLFTKKIGASLSLPRSNGKRLLQESNPAFQAICLTCKPTLRSKNGPQHDKCQVQTVGERMESNHLHQGDLGGQSPVWHLSQ